MVSERLNSRVRMCFWCWVSWWSSGRKTTASGLPLKGLVVKTSRVMKDNWVMVDDSGRAIGERERERLRGKCLLSLKVVKYRWKKDHLYFPPPLTPLSQMSLSHPVGLVRQSRSYRVMDIEGRVGRGRDSGDIPFR